MIPAAILACAIAAWQPLGEKNISAYDAGACCCGKWAGGGTFADGSSVKGQALKVVAAPKGIPFGTTLYIEGVGPIAVRDRGGAIKGDKLDLYMNTHKQALQWGRQHRQVWIWKD